MQTSRKELVKEIIMEPMYTVWSTYLITWLMNKPIRLDNKKCFDEVLEAYELKRVYECSKKLIETLHIDMPAIFLLGDCGPYLNSCDPMYTVIFKRKPVIRLRFSRTGLLIDLARDFYLLYLWSYHADTFFDKGRIRSDMLECVKTKSYAFALIFMREYYPSVRFENGYTADEFIKYLENEHLNPRVMYEVYNFEETILKK